MKKRDYDFEYDQRSIDADVERTLHRAALYGNHMVYRCNDVLIFVATGAEATRFYPAISGIMRAVAGGKK